MNRKVIILFCGAFLVGFLGMKIAQWSTDLYYDHEFVHYARLMSIQRAKK